MAARSREFAAQLGIAARASSIIYRASNSGVANKSVWHIVARLRGVQYSYRIGIVKVA